ncbi:MAG: lysophospholipid acyltransferase family protein [Candidatus Binatia bacterium]
MALMIAVARVGSARLRDLVATALSALAFRLSRGKRRGIEATLARVFGPRLGARRRRAITRRAFREFWVDILSLLPLRGAPGGDVARLIGAEHLREALAGGHGAILWVSNHWAGMSTLKRTLHAHGFAVHKVHAEHHLGGFRGVGDTWVQQRVITPFFDRHESAIVAGIVTIKRGSLAFGRDLAGCLRANGIVCIAADGRVGRRFVPYPFLGIAEAFPTGVVTLARTSGAKLFPTFCLPGTGRTVRVVIEPAIALPAELDREQGIRNVISRYVERLECHARRHPSRYLNWNLVGAALPPAAPP